MWKRMGAFCACASLLALLTSCGGGGSAPTTLTRSNDPGYSRDAQVLASRVADGPWLPSDRMAMFDRDLNRIRTQYPQVADIHAVGDYVLEELIVGVKADAPWLANWQKGTLTTGDVNLDNLLTTYGATSIRGGTFIFEGHTWFVITFAEALNIRALVPLFLAASSNFTYAEPDGYIGDGDRITFSTTSNTKTYVFSHGWGDCPAGCIERHSWTVTLNYNGSIALEESGPPIPEDGGRAASSAALPPTRASLGKLP
jgi:hypothetical protein